MKRLLILILFLACNEDTITNEYKLLDSGYKKFGCDKLSYEDLKSDDSNPYYKIYSNVTSINNNLEMLIARCYDNNTCHHERVFNNEIICQKLYVTGDNTELSKRWVDHFILTFNIKHAL